jgi:hypothetical protein
MRHTFRKLIVFISLTFFFTQSLIAEITFQEILENPADLKINLKYATEQEAIGRYKATLSTLERLSMLYPVNTDIKLYLISILLKMDSVAKLQLMIETMLQDPNTSQETRDYIAEILTTIRKQSNPQPKWFAHLDLSYTQIDNSNIDGVTKSGKLFISDSDENFPIDAIKYDKTYARGSSLTIGKNIDETSAISFNAGLKINTQNKGNTFVNDLASSSVSYSKIFGKNYFIPYAFYTRTNERSEDDLNSRGIGFNNTYNINQNNSISYSSSFVSTKYDEKASTDAVSDDKNNDTSTGSLGYNYTFSDVNLISTKASYTRKDAKIGYNSYDGPGLNIGFTRVLPFGILKLDKTYQTNSYRGKNTKTIHSVINRKDEIETSQIQLSGRLTQVIPHIQLLGRITKLIPVINKLEGDIFYSIKHVETDSESTLLNNSAIRKNTSFNIIKRFTLNE